MLRHPAHALVTGFQHRVEFFGRDGGVRPGVELAGRHRAWGHMWLIWMPVSDDPTPSMTIRPGLTSMRRCLAVGVSKAPPLATAANDDRSAELRSMASAIGRAIASPTTCTASTFSRSIVSTTSSASKRLGVAENTTDWPVVSADITLHCAAPCISGGRVKILAPGFAITRFAISS